jgi:hypothetical protein
LAPGKKNTRSCIICNTSFAPQIISKDRLSNRRTCSMECRGIYYGRVRKSWTDDEIALLHEFAESMPSDQFIRVFNAQNTSNGRPKRSAVSIRLKIHELNLSLEPKYRYLTASGFARFLGISNDAVRYWLQIGLKGTRNRDVPRSPVYIKTEDLCEFARANPRFFGGIPRTQLFLAIEDADLADYIVKTFPNRNTCIRKPMKVRCIETGKIYESQSAAAKAMFVNRSIISRSVRRGHTANGYHFEKINL